MASHATTFTAVNALSPDLMLAAGESLNIIVTRTGAGAFSVQLDERVVGATYAPVGAAITANTAGTVYENATRTPRYFRLRCAAIAGGDSIATTLADVAGESAAGYPIRNAAGVIVFDVVDDGIEAPLVTATTLAGTLSTAAQPAITSVGTLASLAVTAAVTGGSFRSASPTGGIGYAAGAGGAQTQATSKATTVVSNTITTAITMTADALAALATVAFTFTNSTIAATDEVVVTHQSAGTSAAYTMNAFPGAGSAIISVRNNTAGILSEAIVLRVHVTKAVSA